MIEDITEGEMRRSAGGWGQAVGEHGDWGSTLYNSTTVEAEGQTGPRHAMVGPPVKTDKL